MRSVETVSFALTISRARRARCSARELYRLIPVASSRGPRIRKSIAAGMTVTPPLRPHSARSLPERGRFVTAGAHRGLTAADKERSRSEGSKKCAPASSICTILVVGLAGLAIGIPTAQASGQSPDSRPYYRGTDPALAPKSPSPDDRAFSRAIPVSSYVELRTDAASSVPITDARHSALLSHRALPASVSVQPRGFDLGDALIGGTFGLILALLGAGAVAIGLHHRRDVLRTA